MSDSRSSPPSAAIELHSIALVVMWPLPPPPPPLYNITTYISYGIHESRSAAASGRSSGISVERLGWGWVKGATLLRGPYLSIIYYILVRVVVVYVLSINYIVLAGVT